jgi:hypothetical protein
MGRARGAVPLLAFERSRFLLARRGGAHNGSLFKRCHHLCCKGIAASDGTADAVFRFVSSFTQANSGRRQHLLLSKKWRLVKECNLDAYIVVYFVHGESRSRSKFFLLFFFFKATGRCPEIDKYVCACDMRRALIRKVSPSGNAGQLLITMEEALTLMKPGVPKVKTNTEDKKIRIEVQCFCDA